jgi:hypothetical protein
VWVPGIVLNAIFKVKLINNRIMRLTLCILFLLPLLSRAQDCSLKKEPDPFSTKSRLSTGFFDIPGGSLSIDASSREIDFFFLLSGSNTKCFDENSEATLVFEGGKLKSLLKNGGAMNCDGSFHIIFKNSNYTPSVLQRITTRKVITILLKDANEKITTISLSAGQQQTLMQLASCVAKEAKTLL